MGIIHKLKPEVKDFIIGQKKTNPALSCRNLTSLIIEQFQVNVSKSSINAIFKENNLSMPIGRRRKQKKNKFNLPVLPVIEGVKAVMLFAQPGQFIPEQITKVDSIPEEKRIKEAEEWAMRLQEEERIRLEEKLSLEKQRLKDKAIEAKANEAAEKAEQERLAKEIGERAHREAEEAKRLEESAAKAEQEKLAKAAEELVHQAEEQKKHWEEEIALKAEREKWEKLAEEELTQKNEINQITPLAKDRVCSGAILLKAIDCLIGGSKQINEAICMKIKNPPEDFLALTEAVIFRVLFGKDKPGLLDALIGQQIPQEKLDSYYSEIKQNKTLKLEIARIIFNAFTIARGVKVHLADGNIVYLDGQLYTTWPTPYLPFNFASAVYDLKNKLNKYFFQDKPIVLSSAPGNDLPTKEFFNLLLNINLPSHGPDSLVLYGNKLEELESISLKHENNYSFVFGLWPWQFTTCRRIKKIGDFSLEHIENLNKDFYLAEIEIDLWLPSTNQNIALQGCAIKTNFNEKIRLVILSSEQSRLSLNKLAQLYLSCWPNFEEGFRDFSRKVEISTYTGNLQNSFSTENLGLDAREAGLELEEIFANYIKTLDAYLRWNFLPSGYESKDFQITRERFYNLPVKIDKINDKNCLANFVLPSGYAFSQDLSYLSRRINEKEFVLSDGASLYLDPG